MAVRLLLCALLLLGAAAPARAQFRGDERFPRAFAYNSEYFFQSESFEYPTWWDEAWAWGDTGYRMTLGSVKTDEFYLRQEGKLSYPLLSWLRAGYRYVEDEDYDGRYRRHLVRMDAAPFPWARAAAFAELSSFKEWIDLGLELRALAPGRASARLALTFVDATFNRKAGELGNYERKPYSLLAEVRVIEGAGFHALVRLEADLPLRLNDREEGFVFGFERYRAALETRAVLLPRLTLRFLFEGETCRKRWEYASYTDPGDPPDPREERFGREAFEARCDLVWRLGVTTDHLVSAGLWIRQLREAHRHPHDAVEDVRLTKRDAAFYLRVRWDAGLGFFFLPALYVGPVWHRRHYTHDPGRDDERSVPLNSKINLAAGFRFSEHAVLLGSLSFALDRAEFDGGQASFVLSF